MESGHHAEYPPVRQPRQCCLWRRSFVTVGSTGTNGLVLTSSDGNTWTVTTPAAALTLSSADLRELKFLRRQHRRHLSLLERQRQFLVWRDSPIRHYDQHRRDLIRKQSLICSPTAPGLPGKSRRHNLVAIVPVSGASRLRSAAAFGDGRFVFLPSGGGGGTGY